MPNYDELPPGEQPGDDEPLRVDEATQAIIAPLAIDVSVSMRDALPFLQESLATFTGQLRANPLTAEYVHLGVVTFSGAAATDLPVTRAADPRTVLPRLAVRGGGTNFAAGFVAVHSCLREGIAKVARRGPDRDPAPDHLLGERRPAQRAAGLAPRADGDPRRAVATERLRLRLRGRRRGHDAGDRRPRPRLLRPRGSDAGGRHGGDPRGGPPITRVHQRRGRRPRGRGSAAAHRPGSDQPRDSPHQLTGILVTARLSSDAGVAPSVATPVGQAACDGDVTAAEASLPDIEVRVAALRGPAHRLLGGPRQDAAGVLRAGGPWLCVGVADGIGSEPYSANGARAGLRAALGALADTGSPGDAAPVAMTEAVERACRAAHEEAAALAVPPSSVSSTLTVAVVSTDPTPDGGLRCTFVRVGDSPVYLLRADATWHELLPDADGHRPSNVVTSHVPVDPSGATYGGAVLRPGDALVACTDGLGVPLGDGSGRFGAELAARWATPRPVLRFVSDLWYGGFHDDRAAAVVWNTRVADADPSPPPGAERA